MIRVENCLRNLSGLVGQQRKDDMIYISGTNVLTNYCNPKIQNHLATNSSHPVFA